jgi:hypothetical protein
VGEGWALEIETFWALLNGIEPRSRKNINIYHILVAENSLYVYTSHLYAEFYELEKIKSVFPSFHPVRMPCTVYYSQDKNTGQWKDYFSILRLVIASQVASPIGSQLVEERLRP